MKIEHLYYFLVIADTKSINKAAHKLFISQQQLSRVIISLENNLHTQLLERNSAGVELTYHGRIFLQYANKIIADYREMQSYFYLDSLPQINQEETIQGNCQIVLPFFFSLFLNDFITKLNTTYPKINIKCFENAAEYSIDSLFSSDKVHLLLGTPEQKKINEEQKLISYCLGNTSVSICVNRSSPLAQKCVLTQEDVYAHLQTSYPQNIWNHSIFTGNNILFTSSNIYQHLDSVVKNNSICIVPTYIQSGITVTYPEIILIPVNVQYSFPIYIVHSREHVLSVAEKAVIRFLAQYVQGINTANTTSITV